jgi:hypothetical protein
VSKPLQAIKGVNPNKDPKNQHQTRLTTKRKREESAAGEGNHQHHQYTSKQKEQQQKPQNLTFRESKGLGFDLEPLLGSALCCCVVRLALWTEARNDSRMHQITVAISQEPDDSLL